MFLLRICLNHRKETYGQTLAEICRAVRIEVMEKKPIFRTCKQSVFREEQCLRDICVTFKSLFRLVLHFFIPLIDYID